MGCLGSGILECHVSLNRGGYVPGESIGINARVVNRSKVMIKSTKAALTEVSTW